MEITVQVAWATESFKHVTLEVADARPETIKAAIDKLLGPDGPDFLYENAKEDLDGCSATYIGGIVDGAWEDIYTGGDDLPIPVELAQATTIRDWIFGTAAKQPEALKTVLLDILSYEEPEEDGDIVEAFSEFQRRLQVAMFSTETVLPMSAPQVIGDLTEALEEALDQHIYDASNGDEPEPGCAYVTAVQAGKAWLASATIEAEREAPLPEPGPGQFIVRKKVDAYVNYEAVVDAATPEEAAKVADRDFGGTLRWVRGDVDEFDATGFITLDAEGMEIDGTQAGDL
jgi:hypothetical protein